MLEIIVLPLLTMVTCKETCAVIIALHKKGCTDKDDAAGKIAPKSIIYRIIKNFQGRGSIGVKKASGRPKKVQQAPGPSPKVNSAAGSCLQHCRACSGTAAGRCECICTHSEDKTFAGWPGVKKGSKEPTSLLVKTSGTD